LLMPVTPPVRVTICHIRWPLRVYGRVIFRLFTADGGDFVSARHPTVYDPTGQPTALAADLAPGSIVRVEHGERGALRSIQLIDAKFANPFARLLRNPNPISNPVWVVRPAKNARFIGFWLSDARVEYVRARILRGAGAATVSGEPTSAI
jgi:hypothetical protein